MRATLELLPQPAFRADALGAPVTPGSGRVAVAVSQGNATLLVGAGISAAPPTDLPTGPRLAAALLRSLVVQGIDIVGLIENTDDLGDVATAIEARMGRPSLVRLIREAAPWDQARFNLAHLAIALLTAEGLLGRVLTVNWDRKILEAGSVLHASALDAAFDADSLSAATVPMYVQLHGQLEQPASLVATQADLASHHNLDWAKPMLQAALAETGLVLIGFGSEPSYVVDSLDWAIQVAAEAPLAVISDKAHADFVSDAPRLSRSAGITEEGDSYIREDAAQLLGEVLRSVYQARVRAALVKAAERAKIVGADRVSISERATENLRAFILDRPLIDLMELLWRGNALVEEMPDQALLPSLGAQENALINVLATLLILASAADVTGLKPKGAGVLLEAADLTVDLWPVVPTTELSASQAVTAVAPNTLGFSSAPDSAIPLVLLIGGTWGVVPQGGHVSLLEGPPPESILVGQRFPSDALTLETLQGRIETLGQAQGQPPLRNMLRVGGTE